MEIIDSNRLEQSQIKSDVCIIGAGPAGITLAYALRDSGLQIVIAESGGKTFERHSNELNRIKVNSNFEYRGGESKRNRQIGGSAKLWVGRVVPFQFQDNLDQEWGVLRNEIENYTNEALRLFGINPRIQSISGQSNHELQAYWSQKTERFSLNSEIVSKIQDCRLFHHLTLIGQPEFGQKRVRSFCFMNQQNQIISITARHFVFAMGGVENSRMLLNCFSSLQNRMGSAVNRIGKYIMDHPRIWHGKLIPTEGAISPSKYQIQYSPFGLYKIGIRNAPASNRIYCNLMRDQGRIEQWLQKLPIRRFAASSKKLIMREKGFGKLLVNEFLRRWPQSQKNSIHRNIIDGFNKSSSSPYNLMIYCEQRPRAENRIELLREKDRYGLPRVKIVNHIHAEELEEVLRFLQHFEEKCRAWNYKLHYDPQAVLNSNNYTDASHLMGGTRYSADKDKSVLNRDLSLIGIPNLHLLGSSVFPTGGVENPTHLILCLSLYLAKVLKTNI